MDAIRSIHYHCEIIMLGTIISENLFLFVICTVCPWHFQSWPEFQTGHLAKCKQTCGGGRGLELEKDIELVGSLCC